MKKPKFKPGDKARLNKDIPNNLWTGTPVTIIRGPVPCTLYGLMGKPAYEWTVALEDVPEKVNRTRALPQSVLQQESWEGFLDLIEPAMSIPEFKSAQEALDWLNET